MKASWHDPRRSRKRNRSPHGWWPGVACIGTSALPMARRSWQSPRFSGPRLDPSQPGGGVHERARRNEMPNKFCASEQWASSLDAVKPAVQLLMRVYGSACKRTFLRWIGNNERRTGNHRTKTLPRNSPARLLHKGREPVSFAAQAPNRGAS